MRKGLFFPTVGPLASYPAAETNKVDYVSIPLELDGDNVDSVEFVLTPPIHGKEYFVMISNCAYVKEDGQEVRRAMSNQL